MAPYPAEWERHLQLSDGCKIFVRPIRPADDALYGPFLAAEAPEDLRLRFFGPVKELSAAQISRFTHIDYERAMAFIALSEPSGEMLGVARIHLTPAGDSGEYAVIVRSDLKSHGLGWQLMQLLIAFARQKKLRSIQGQVLYENVPMLDMCKELGFSVRTNPNESDICDVNLSL
jgi:acetyltransferase